MIETYGLYLLLATLPLEQLSTMGVTAVKLAGSIALVAWTFSRLRSDEPIRWDAGLTLMALFIGWGALSLSWSVDFTQSMWRLQTYALLLVLYLLITNVVRNEEHFSTAMKALWLGALVLVTSGTVDLAGRALRGPGFRVAGITGNPNGYVTMILAITPCCYWMLTHSRARFFRVVTVAALALAAITSLNSLSRGGAVAIAVSLLALVVTRLTGWRMKVLVLLVSGLLFYLTPDQLRNRFDETRRFGGDVRTLDLWPAGLRAFGENPLTGSGVGTNARTIAPLVRSVGNVVHNAPLAVAVELGLPGLVLYIGFVAYAPVRLLRALKSSGKRARTPQTVFAAVLLASFLGYVTTWLKNGGAEYHKALWLFLALMSVYSRVLEQSALAGSDDGEPGVGVSPIPEGDVRSRSSGVSG